MRGKLMYSLLSQRMRHVSFKGLKKDHAEAFAAFIQFLEKRGDDVLVEFLITADDLINDKYYVFIPPMDERGVISGAPLIVPKLKKYSPAMWKPILCDKLAMNFDEVCDMINATA